MSDDFYRRFEDRYRGQRAIIKERLRNYLPFVTPLRDAGLSTALDLGCGRGEWLELLVENGFSAHGVDLNEAMLDGCREHGLDVELVDAVNALRAKPDNSVALLSAFHLVEHIPFVTMVELVRHAMRVLVPGGLLILETPNPENLTVGTASFYLDPSHERPLPPALLDFVVEQAGFERHLVVRLQEDPALHGDAPIGLINVIEGVSPDYSIVAQKGGDSVAAAALAAPFSRSYGLSLGQLGERFERQEAERRAEIHGHISRVAERTDQIGHEVGVHMAQLSERTEAIAAHLSQALAETSLALQEARQVGGARLDQIESEIARVNAQRAAAEAERAVAELERANAQHERARAEAERTAAQAERDNSARDLERQRHRIEELERHLDEVRHLHAEMSEQYTQRLQTDAVTELLRRAEHELQMAAEAHQRERMILHGHIGAIEGRLDDLLASRSWRVTAPLRGVRSGLRALRASPQGGVPATAHKSTDNKWRHAVRQLGRSILRQPRLKRAVLALLAHAPRLRARLRLLMYQAPATSAPPLPPLQDRSSADLSPRAARAHAALLRAMPTRTGEQG